MTSELFARRYAAYLLRNVDQYGDPLDLEPVVDLFLERRPLGEWELVEDFHPWWVAS